MTTYDANLVNMVDARIRAVLKRDSTVGTIVDVDSSGVYALVTFDGDDRPMPVKWVSGMGWLIPDTRVALDRIGSDWYITRALSNLTYWPKQDQTLNSIGSFTNTAAAVGSPTVGFDFKAPLSGAIFVTVGGQIQQANVGNTTYLSFQIRTGTDYASGVTVFPFNFVRSIAAGAAVVTGGSPGATGVARWPVTGLTPGADYVIRLGHWTSPAGTGNSAARMVVVEPWS